MAVDVLEQLCVTNQGDHRLYLFGRLCCYLEELARIGAQFEVWVDGSFVTSKTNPSDIDIVIWYDEKEVDLLPISSQQMLAHLTSDKQTIKSRYNIDVYVEPNGNIHTRAYWRGLYCFVKETEIPKGIANISIGSPS